MFVQSLQSRVREGNITVSVASLKVDKNDDLNVPEHSAEAVGLGGRLVVLLIIPFFFIAPQNVPPAPIDAQGILDRIAVVTAEADARMQSGRVTSAGFLNEGSAYLSWKYILEQHMASFTKRTIMDSRVKMETQPLLCPWGPIAAAVSLYFGILLHLWQPDALGGLSLRLYLPRTVLSHLYKTSASMRVWDTAHQHLWFWMAFVLALGLWLPMGENPDQEAITIQYHAQECVREWIALSGVTTWEEAKEVLQSVVWPKYIYNDYEASTVWTMCSTPVGSTPESSAGSTYDIPSR
jgi:hypothetical protein